jgi:hypothetical protein
LLASGIVPSQTAYLRIDKDGSFHFQDLHLERLLDLENQRGMPVTAAKTYFDSQIDSWIVNTTYQVTLELHLQTSRRA